MGLDAIEIIVQVEDIFEITLPDAEVSEVRTVGDLHELILRTLDARDEFGPGPCMTAMAFYRLRRALVEVAGQNRQAIRPAAPLGSVLPSRRRRALWRGLSERMGLTLPDLTRGGWFAHSLMVFGVASFFASLVAGQWLAWPWLWPVLWAAGFATLAVLVERVTRPLAVTIEGDAQTVGELARLTADRNAGRLVRRLGAINRRETFAALVGVVSCELGVRAEDIGPDTRWVEDLNCG